MKTIIFKKRLALAIVGGAVLLSGFLSTLLLPQKSAEAWECQEKNVIRCGVSDRNDLANKIENGDGVHTDIKTIFNNIGIYSDDILSQDAVGGVLKKDGSVWVGSQQVATGTVVGFRNAGGMTGTPFSGLVWQYSSTQFSPGVDQVGAYVYMRNGQFKYAVIVSCGNPILKKLQPIPQSLKIEKTVKNITAAPNSDYSESVNAKVGETVEFKVKVTNNGDITVENVFVGDQLPQHLTLVPGSAVATIKEYDNGWKTKNVTYADSEVPTGKNLGAFEPGEDAVLILRAKVTDNLPVGCNTFVDVAFAKTSKININDKANVVVCIAQKEEKPEEPESPEVPPVTPAGVPPAPVAAPVALPISGPVEAAAGVLGTGALGYTGYMWRRSRKRLIDSLKDQ